jgi:hypothetical protein
MEMDPRGKDRRIIIREMKSFNLLNLIFHSHFVNELLNHQEYNLKLTLEFLINYKPTNTQI